MEYDTSNVENNEINRNDLANIMFEQMTFEEARKHIVNALVVSFLDDEVFRHELRWHSHEWSALEFKRGNK